MQSSLFEIKLVSELRKELVLRDMCCSFLKRDICFTEWTSTKSSLTVEHGDTGTC